jgi:phosphatidylglycerol lysyltransferase
MQKSTTLKKNLLTFYKKRPFWQLVLATLVLVLTIYFVKNERGEVHHIKEKLSEAIPLYVILGIIFTGFYIAINGLMYQMSFRSVHQKVGLWPAIDLYLKRNLISVFLPAGGFSSMAFFTKPMEKAGASKVQIYFASYIYALSGLLSVVVVAVPALGYLLLKHQLRSFEIYAFIGLIVLCALAGYGAWSFFTKGWVFRLLSEAKPDLSLLIDELRSQDFSVKYFILTVLSSVLIEITGIIHVYLALYAIGAIPTLESAIIGYIVMVMLLVASPFLRGLGAIEVSMTLVLTSYGFSTVDAASSTLLFRLFEFWLPLFAGVISFVARKDNVVLRVLPAFIILGLGIVNIVTAIDPHLPLKLHMLGTVIPYSVVYYSNYFVLVAGIAFCILSFYLLRGVRSAWIIAVILTFLSLAGHIAKGGDILGVVIAAIGFASLVITRDEYFLQTDRVVRKRTLSTIPLVFIATFIYGIAGFYYLNFRHFGINFDFQQSVEALFRMIFLLDVSGLHPQTRFAHYFIDSIYTTVGFAVAYTIFIFVKPYFDDETAGGDTYERANSLLEKYGDSALGYFKTYKDKLIYFSENGGAFVSYKRFRSFAAVLGDPVAEKPQAMTESIEEFDDFCARNNMQSFYYRVPEESLPIYIGLHKKSLLIGQEAVVDLEQFSLQGGAMKSLRNAINKIESAGYKAVVYEAPVMQGVIQKLQLVSNEWLHHNGRKEIFFAQGGFDAKLLKQQTIIAVEDAEQAVVAFLNIVPDFAPNEGTYDLIRKTENAPNGVVDFLLVRMFDYFREKNIRYVNLGLAPFAGHEQNNTAVGRAINYAYEHIRQFSAYKGLRDYKEKFNPEWHNRYLVYSNVYDLIQIPVVLRGIFQAGE